MNFETIESLWAGQVAAPVETPEMLERQHALLSEFKRRGRFLAYEAFGLAFALIVTPLLSVVNYLYLPRAGTPWYWLNATLHLLVLVGCATLLVRRMQRHRALRRARVSTLREQAEVSVASFKAEAQDYRRLPWLFGIWIALAVFSIATNSPFHGGSWQAVTLRVGLVLGFFGTIGAAIWHHYRTRFLPDYARQQEICRQLG